MVTDGYWPTAPVTYAGSVNHWPAGQSQPGSVTPSQSSSRPLQVSAEGCTPPMHAPKVPPTQVRVPKRHTPMFEPHCCVWPVMHMPDPHTLLAQSIETQSRSSRQAFIV